MNAWQPSATTPPRDPVRKVRTPTQPPVRASQGVARRYRLRYAKLGRVAYLGHLDLVRHLPRIFRRAGLEIFYSLGFHPKPEMVFGPALALGTASLSEYIDIKLDGAVPFDRENLIERLNAVSELGLRFIACVELGAEDASVNKVIDEAIYIVGIPRAAYCEPNFIRLGATSDASLAKVVQQRLADSAGGDPLIIARDIEGLKKKVEVSKFLRDVRVGEAENCSRNRRHRRLVR